MGAQVEVEQAQVLGVVGTDGALGHGGEVLARRVDREVLESAAGGDGGSLAGAYVEGGVLWGPDPGRRYGCLEQPSVPVGVQQERSELVTDPEGARGIDLERLGVEVESGEQACRW